jgi:hypothetical protein
MLFGIIALCCVGVGACTAGAISGIAIATCVAFNNPNVYGGF